MMQLPEPKRQGAISLEQTLNERRSIRAYDAGALNLGEVSQLLWAAQGMTGGTRFRAAPSAGATYPLETYLVAGEVDGLEPGLYHYVPQTHSLTLVKQGDMRAELSDASLAQPCVRDASAVIVISAIYERTTETYGDRGKMYVHMDVGHAAQNILLQATALGLGAVPVGAFRTRTIGGMLGLSETELPLYLVPIGRV
jgi:SagB-type dehydrogenase family enzyme